MLTTYLKRQTTLTTYYTSSAGPYLMVQLTLKRGQFRTSDKLIASLRGG
jgi:hypothetical protein